MINNKIICLKICIYQIFLVPLHHIIKHMTKDELIREIQLKRQLSELDGSPVPEYDPSDGMESVEELKRFVRFLYSSLQEKDR